METDANDAKRIARNIRRKEARREKARQKRIKIANERFTPAMRLDLVRQQAQVNVNFARLQEALRDPIGFAARQKLEEYGPLHHAFGSDCSPS